MTGADLSLSLGRKTLSLFFLSFFFSERTANDKHKQIPAAPCERRTPMSLEPQHPIARANIATSGTRGKGHLIGTHGEDGE